MNRWLMDRYVGVDGRRPLPAFARENFERWFARRKPASSSPRGSVILFHDTFNTYNTPAVAIAATELLEHSGYRVLTVPRQCCGRPLISKGMLRDAKSYAEWNVGLLLSHVERGIPVVGLEPSCLLTLRDEYPDLLRNAASRLVADQSFLIEEFLMREGVSQAWNQQDLAGGQVLLHGHCHQKALVGMTPTVAVLENAGYQVSEAEPGCCGMAGSFGFEKEHYDLSVSIAERQLVPAVKSAAAQIRVAASGISCRQQIEHLTGRRPVHPVELLWEKVRGQGSEARSQKSEADRSGGLLS